MKGIRRTPADACEQAAAMYEAIAGDDSDSGARRTALLLRDAAARCREPRAVTPPPAAASPAPEPAERPSVSKIARLVRAAQSCLHYVPTAGAAEVYREELVDALQPFRAVLRPVQPEPQERAS